MRKYLILLLILFFAVTVSAQTLQVNNTGVTWISNTDQCLSRCEAWLEINLIMTANNVKVPLVPNLNFALGMTKETRHMAGLTDYGVEVYEKIPVTITDYCQTEQTVVLTKETLDLNGEACTTVHCIEGKEKETCDCLQEVQQTCGSHADFELKKVSDNYLGFNFEKGKTYRLRIWGNRKAQLQNNSVDWVLTFDGRKFTEWDWWNSDWEAKYPINSLVVAEDLNTNSWINLQALDFSGLSSACVDGADITVVNETTQTEVTDLNFQGWDGTITDADVNILFKVTEVLPADTYNGEYYIYSNNDACTANNNRTIYESAYDGFEDNDYTVNGYWTVVEGAAAVSVAGGAAAKNGSYGLKVTMAGLQHTVFKTFGFTEALQPDKPPYKVCSFMKTDDVSLPYMYYYMRGGGQATGYFGISGDNFIASAGGGATYTGWTTTPLDNTWYKLCMDFPKTGNITYDIFDASENLIESYAQAGARFGSLQTLELSAQATGINIYFDDLSYTFPRKPSYVLGVLEETDTTPPTVYPISLSGFITTENDFINGTGYFYALATDNVDVNNCEYTINGTDWLIATWDGVYCTSPTFTIIDEQFYSFNFTALDIAINSGKGTDLNYTGKTSLVDVSAINDDDFINLGYTFVNNVFLGMALMAVALVLILFVIFAKKMAFKK